MYHITQQITATHDGIEWIEYRSKHIERDIDFIQTLIHHHNFGYSLKARKKRGYNDIPEQLFYVTVLNCVHFNSTPGSN